MNLPNLENVPPEMKALPNWILWKYELKKDSQGNLKKTKVPRSTKGGEADSTDPATWATFEEAKETFTRKKALSPAGACDGLGFVFCEDSGIMGVDFDHIKDKSGEWDPEALEEIKSLNSYTEISPGGDGAHVIVMGVVPLPPDDPRNGRNSQKLGREMYHSKRFFTVTGEKADFSGDGIRFAQREINQLYKKWFEPAKEAPKPETPIVKSASLSNSEIVDLCRHAKNGGTFESLYSGSWKGSYPSQSEADQALCNILAFYTQDSGQIDSIFQSSGLYRKKWDRRDYKNQTIDNAVNGVTKTYSPGEARRTAKKAPRKNAQGQPESSQEQPENGGFMGGVMDLKSVEGRGVIYHTLARDFAKGHSIRTLEGDQKIRIYKDGIYPDADKDLEIQNSIYKLGFGYNLPLSPGHVDNVTRIIKSSTYISMEDCEPDAEFKLCVNNGVLNFKTFELEEHSPEKVFFSKLPVDYDPKAPEPELFLKYIRETFKGNEEQIDLLQEMAGYCLYKSMPYHVVFFLIGDGGAGKGVFLRIIDMFLGRENIAAVPLHDLLNPKNDYDLASLRGKHVNMTGEVSAKEIEDFAKAKDLTGGDRIKARFPRGSPFTFVNYAKVLVAGNKFPKINDPTRGLRRRLKIIDFQNKVSSENAIEDIEKKMAERGELPGVMLWAVEGLKRLLENGGFTDERTEAQMALAYKRKSDPVRYFAEECIDECNTAEGDPEFILAVRVLECYTKFAEKNNLPSVELEDLRADILSYCKECDIKCEYKRGRLSQLGKGDQKAAKTQKSRAKDPRYQCFRWIRLCDPEENAAQDTLNPVEEMPGLCDPIFRKTVRDFMRTASPVKTADTLTDEFCKKFSGFRESVGEENIRTIIKRIKTGYKL